MSISSTASAEALFAEGRLEEAVAQLREHLRHQPTDRARRSFLFELLSFAGDYAGADRQLAAIMADHPTVEAAVASYRGALEAERVREHMFDTGDLPAPQPANPVPGTLNGDTFSAITDGDERIGARLEVVAGGRYLWIPFTHIASVVIEAPTRLRDLRWLTARVSTNASVKDLELGEVLLPALTPAIWRSDDVALRLGRATDWVEDADGGFRPLGQKVLRIDDRYVPLVDVRTLILSAAP